MGKQIGKQIESRSRADKEAVTELMKSFIEKQIKKRKCNR